MPTPISTRRRAGSPETSEFAPVPPEEAVAPWLEVVSEKVQSIRFGTVQITVHDSRVVQIERVERTRFELPRAAQST